MAGRRIAKAEKGAGVADTELAVALATGATVADAAKLAGVSERTAYRRLEDEGFRLLVAQLGSQIARRTYHRLTGLLEDAVAALEDLLQKRTPPQVRLSAAKLVLELRRLYCEEIERDERLDRLERLLEGRAGDGEAAGE